MKPLWQIDSFGVFHAFNDVESVRSVCGQVYLKYSIPYYNEPHEIVCPDCKHYVEENEMKFAGKESKMEVEWERTEIRDDTSGPSVTREIQRLEAKISEIVESLEVLEKRLSMVLSPSPVANKETDRLPASTWASMITRLYSQLGEINDCIIDLGERVEA